jgi:NADPH2:quinone reductase
VIGCYTATSREIETVLGLVAAGKLKPVVYKVLPLAEAAKAHELMAARKQVGKIVLVP